MALMNLAVLLVLPLQVLSQYTQTLTDDNGKSIYVPTPGSTSSVAAPAATPTIIYNCQQMPLICENVANWAKSNGNTNGDLPQNGQLFHFDPDPDQKNGRRRTSCGCFAHDDCPNANSNGKKAGTKITDIATSTMGATTAISAAASNIILAGQTPGVDNNGNSLQRNPIPNIPGRFFGQGTSFSCDEFPAAVFIQGGTGAKTICAMHAWSIYQSQYPKDKGKWPLPPKSGRNWEQDWQGRLHDYLRKFFGIAGSKGKNARLGWGTVYPFYLATVTSSQNPGKGFLVIGQATSKTVLKRNAMPATQPAENPAAATYVVSGDETLDRREGNSIAKNHPRADSDYKPEPVPAPTITRPAVLAARQGTSATPAAVTTGSCTADFEQAGAEDIDFGDPAFDDPLDPDLSKPECNNAAQVSASDVQDSIDALDSLGNDGYQLDNCCGGGTNQCSPQMANGTAAIELCGGDTEECIGCSMLANYLQGIHDNCQTDGQVGGNQTINQANDLYVTIALHDTT